MRGLRELTSKQEETVGLPYPSECYIIWCDSHQRPYNTVYKVFADTKNRAFGYAWGNVDGIADYFNPRVS